MENIEITTMCALFNEDKSKLLFIDRIKSWKGYAFPGGHLEEGESIRTCVIREMQEETGVSIIDPEMVGITHFFNPEDKSSHIIFNFIADHYEGKVKQKCDEGKLVWVDINHLDSLPYAEGMELRLDLFLDRGCKEMYVEWSEHSGYTKIEKKVV